jgi:hypothetical protein
MRRELTREQIRANLKKEYGTKPGRTAIAAIAAGAVIGILCLGTGRLPAVLLCAVFMILGIMEKRKSSKAVKQIDADEFEVKEGICREKKIGNGQSGTKRMFQFDDKSCYVASAQDVKLWEKTRAGDGFYMIYFHGSDEIKKIYPMSIFAYKTGEETNE